MKKRGQLHNQVPTKINAIVDEGVKDLIAALSEFPLLQTEDSCQGGKGSAFVQFVYGDQWGDQIGPEWKDLSQFLFGFFAPEFYKTYKFEGKANRPLVRIFLEYHEIGRISAAMEIPPKAMRRTVQTIREIRKRFRRPLGEQRSSHV